jgi:hypothetical protein
MKRKLWLVSVLFAFAVLISACGDGGGPDTQAVEPTSPANVPQRTQAPAASPPAALATEEAAPVEIGSLPPAEFAKQLGAFILRPEDLAVAYKIPVDGERRISNAGVLQERGEVEGKRYIVATRRVDGWYLQLERRHKEDISPAFYESRLELFETQDGAELALQPEWFQANQDPDNTPSMVEGGCNIGSNCTFYYFETLDKVTNLTHLQYHMTFTYRNLLVWVMGRGLDIDVSPDFVREAAQTILTKLESAPLATQ